MASRSPSNTSNISEVSPEAVAHAIQTPPTGLSAVPPPGPARPVVASADAVDDTFASTPSRISCAPAANVRRVSFTDSSAVPGAPGVGVVEGAAVRWLGEQVIDAGTPPAPANWRTVVYDLPAPVTTAVGIVVKVAYGGPHSTMNEEAFLDEIRLE